MHKLLQAVGWMTLAQVASTLFRILNGKVTALVLGPEGMGILAQLYQLKDLFFQYASLGGGHGIVRYTASGIADEKHTFVQRLISSAVTIVVILSTVVVLGCCFFARHVSWMVFGRKDLYLFLLVFVPTLPLLVVGSVLNNVLVGMKEIRRLAFATIFIAVFACGLTMALVLAMGLGGAVIAASVESGVFLLAYWWFLRRTDLAERILPERIFSLDRQILSMLLKFGLTTLFAGNISSLSTLLIRSLLVHRLGAEANGIYQAALVMTTQSISMLLTAMSTYMFPRISELGQDYAMIIAEKNNALRLCLLLGGPILCGLLVLREWIIPLLTSSEFLPAAELLPFQAIGSLFMLLSWGIGIGLLAMERFVTHSALQLVRFLTRPVLFLLLFPHCGLVSISIAYVLAEGLVAFLYYAYHRRAIGFRLTQRNAWLSVSTVALVCITAVMSSMQGVALRYAVPIGLILIWAPVSVSKNERTQAIQWVQSLIRSQSLSHFLMRQ